MHFDLLSGIHFFFAPVVHFYEITFKLEIIGFRCDHVINDAVICEYSYFTEDLAFRALGTSFFPNTFFVCSAGKRTCEHSSAELSFAHSPRCLNVHSALVHPKDKSMAFVCYWREHKRDLAFSACGNKRALQKAETPTGCDAIYVGMRCQSLRTYDVTWILMKKKKFLQYTRCSDPIPNHWGLLADRKLELRFANGSSCCCFEARIPWARFPQNAIY